MNVVKDSFTVILRPKAYYYFALKEMFSILALSVLFDSVTIKKA